jgi:phage terminase small subunit
MTERNTKSSGKRGGKRTAAPTPKPKTAKAAGSQQAGRSHGFEETPSRPEYAEGLTDKEWLFVLLYTGNGFNGTQAAIDAGYSDRSARSIASENLKKPDIRRAVDERLNEMALGASQILAGLADHANASMEDFIDIDAKGKPALNLNKAKARGKLHLIKKLSYDRNGRPQIELFDSLSPKVQLGRHHGLFVERHEHTGKNGGPIQHSLEEWKAKAKQQLEQVQALEDDESED